ncbi:acetyltransferase [Bacillus sp. SA1-12]|uniref:GNAT family N-acetyltransferase n=1 Tax=Bacillus sp. SA1-12 TaxID=1455638 RepID=UPI0006272662|nr:GNAT family N-acetyltransferase [Bacillus sp. SA1-12]KKI89022.1 acetyltransferase [Bacillus sp. SA1-12]
MSIAQLSIANHKEVVTLFGREIENYYFFINDLVTNNYQGKHFKVFGEYENGELVSILLNNFNNVSYYSNTERNVDIYKEILDTLTYSKLSGPSKLIEKFIPYINVKEDALSHMGFVKNISAKRRYPEMKIKIVQSEKEIEMQYDLFLLTKEFQGSLPNNKNDYIKMESERLKKTNDRTVYLSIDNEIVSSAATIKEGEKSAIIIGVFTNPNFRGKGFGTEVLIGLFEMLLKEGKYSYLFYSNPVARNVYKNLGMIEVCEWRVLVV